MKSTLCLLIVLVGSARVHAQTIGELGDRRICSTRGGEVIAQQLAAYQRDCITPGRFVRFHPHDNIILNYPDQIHPYLQASARDAVWSVADAGNVIRVSSAFRPISDQYLLWRSLGGPSSCIDAATPGNSRHQSGRALDLSNSDDVAGVMNAAGCIRLVGDPPHFDCPGENLGADSIRAFQVLWNRNNPADAIAEDGAYGPQTESRLRQAPASGFASAECPTMECEPGCDGPAIINSDCTTSLCGALGVCSTVGGAPICASAFCSDGESVTEGFVCVPNGTALIECNADGSVASTMTCDCVTAGGAHCEVDASDAGVNDAGTMDAGMMDASFAVDASIADGGDLPGGCACHVSAGRNSRAPISYLMVFGVFVLARQRSRRRR